MEPLDNMQIGRHRLSEQVATQLKDLMLTSQLKPGDRLPPERTLAEKLGISRSIIREAIKQLEQQGLVSVQVGRGTFVSKVQPGNVTGPISVMMRQSSEDMSFEHLYEIRQMIEHKTAHIAALRATEEDIAVLNTCLEDMKKYEQAADIERFTGADTEFHTALAHATHNPLFLTLLMPIRDLLRQIQRTASQKPGGPKDAIQYHTRILEAIKQGDAAESERAMREHLVSVMGWLHASDDSDKDA